MSLVVLPVIFIAIGGYGVSQSRGHISSDGFRKYLEANIFNFDGSIFILIFIRKKYT